MSKIDIRRKVHPSDRHGPIRTIHWRKAVPFAMSRRGLLVHRIRFAASYIFDGEWDHDSAEFWCGNSVNSPSMFEEFPDGRLLCARCEAIAVSKGLPSADALAGRHVCIGTMRVARLCCKGTQN